MPARVVTMERGDQVRLYDAPRGLTAGPVTQTITLTTSQGQTVVLVNQPQKAFSLSQAQGVTLVRQTQRSFALSQAQTATLARQAQKNFAASQAQTATLTTIRLINIALSASQATTATLVRQTRKILVASQAQVATLVRLTSHLLSASQAQTATLARQAQKTLAASQATSVSLALSKVYALALSASQATTATLVRRTNKLFTPAQAQVATLVRSSARAFAVSQATTTTLTRRAARLFSPSQATSVTLDASTKNKNISFSVSQATSPTLVRRTNKIFAVSEFARAGLAKIFAHTFPINQAQSTTLTRLFKFAPPINTAVPIIQMGTAYNQTILSVPGLINYWRLDETAGSFADPVGGATGTAHGTVTQGAAGLVSGGDGAISLPGTASNYIDTASITIPAAVTIEAWIKPNVTTTQNIAGFQTSTFVFLATNRFYVRDSTSTDTQVGRTTTLVAGQTYHFVGVYDAAQSLAAFYINGVKQGTPSRTPNNPAQTLTEPLIIGSDLAHTTEMFNGTIDEVAIYNVALTEQQILTHYLSGLALRPNLDATAMNVGLTVGVVSRGTWVGQGMTFTQQWQRDDGLSGVWTNIAGAAALSYPVTGFDRGHRLRAIVTGANSGGSVSATSNVLVVGPVAGATPVGTITFTSVPTSSLVGTRPGTTTIPG